MVTQRPKDYVEFHDGEKEFCPESGPLVTKKIKAPSAVIKALVASVLTAATVYTIASMPIFSFLPSLVDVVANVAVIETQMENLPEEASVVYTVSLEDEPNEIVFSGEIHKNTEQLKFTNLKYDTEYVVTFYLKDNDSKEFLKEIKFKTGKEKIDIPEDPIVPEEPEVPEIPEEPEVEEEPIKPTVPEATIKTDVVVEGADGIFENDEFQGFAVEEIHTFSNVPSYEYEIMVNEDQVSYYEDYYDEETQTVTVVITTRPLSYGETATTKVVLTHEDGESATSTNSFTIPAIEAVALEVVDNKDGTYTFHMNGSGFEPFIGSVELSVKLYTDEFNVTEAPVIQTFTTDKVAFEESYTCEINAPGKTLTATAFVQLVWSEDTNYMQDFEAGRVEYYLQSNPEFVSNSIDGAEAFIDNDEFAGYAIEETHVFGNVPSDEYEISINDGEITNYETVYDVDAQTVTVTFVGNPIGLGETSTTEVILTYKDGESASSTTTVQTPKIDAVTLEVIDNQDGTFTYQMNGSGVEPSVGDVETRITLYTDINAATGYLDTQTYTKDTVAFEQSYTGGDNAPGKKTALVFVEVVWLLDTTTSNQLAEATVDYEILDVSEISFTDIYEEGAGYAYTVNAKFANLANAVPQSVDFYRQVYNPMYPDEVEEEQLIMTLDASEITIDDNFNILASYTVNEDQVVGRESSGNTWRIVLTYLDLNNVTCTVELVDYIEPFSPAFNHLNSVMWQENGVTYADYEMVFSFSKDYSPNGAELVRYDAYNWEILSAELELTDSLGFVRGQMMTDRTTELSMNLYLDWLATPAEEYIYSGCGGAGYREFTITNQELVANADNTGYASTSEEFTLFNGSDYVSEYSNEYILVTLADGTQIKVSEDETDASGVVTVNWNDNNNVVVTVNQTDVLLGQTAIVDFVTESVREEEAMFGLVNSYTYRCFSNYE
ncbi:MAG: hypothetical protein IKY26_04665 [Erysipelotrichaceae bacterium]|nr:hypothetical protein [Erysipelotrichaceae bacterium]